MRIVRSVVDLRAALAPERAAGRSIGLVPTMGYFHEGHLSLMRQARADCDFVVVSLFVNPAQFGEGEDLASYPRDERRDAELAGAEGVDLLFAPPLEEVYPDGFATVVAVGRPDRRSRRRCPPGPLRRRDHRRDEALQHGPARTSPTSARRTPSRRSSSGSWCATSTCPCGSRSAPRCASRTAWR